MNGEKRNDNTDEHRSSTTGWEVIGDTPKLECRWFAG